MNRFHGLEFVVWLALAGLSAACGGDGRSPPEGAGRDRDGDADCPPGTVYVAAAGRCAELKAGARDSGDMPRPNTATEGGALQDGGSFMSSPLAPIDLDAGAPARDSSPEVDDDASGGPQDGSLQRPDALCGAGDCDGSLADKPIDDGHSGRAEAGSNEVGACRRLTWFCDSDGDSFAVNSVGKVTSCTKPSTNGTCADWTTRVPAGVDTQDCDDGSALRFPGTGFGLSPSSNGDVNCDGEIETKLEFVASNLLIYSSTTQFNICKDVLDRAECDCWVPTALGKGFRQMTPSGPELDDAVPYSLSTFPCAESAGDVVFLMHKWTSGQACIADKEVVVVRQLCR